MRTISQRCSWLLAIDFDLLQPHTRSEPLPFWFKLLVLVLSLTAAAMAKKPKKKCSRPRCRNDAASPRAKICTACFKKNASFASLKRKAFRGGGNRGAAGVQGNRGNTTTGQKKKMAGKRSALRRSTEMWLVVKKRVGRDPFKRQDLGDPRCTDEAAREFSFRIERSWWPHRWPMSYYRLFRH